MSSQVDPASESASKSKSAFVAGLAVSERPSAKQHSRATRQGSSSNSLSNPLSKSLAPLRDFGNPQENQQESYSNAPLKDAGGGKLAIKDLDSGEFEPGWGVETKPRSQREIFLTEQAFAQGKQKGEEEAGKLAHAQGLKEGRESGYKQGFQDGTKERAFEIEQRAEEMAEQITDKRIETIANFLEQLTQREKEASHRRDTELMALMIAIFDKVLPALAEENGEKEVQFFLKAILQRFENIPQVSITLAEGAQELVEMLRGRVEALMSDDKSVDKLVSFQFDPSFTKADCKIAWAEGEVERRFHSLWEEVKQALQQHLPNTLSEKTVSEKTTSEKNKSEKTETPSQNKAQNKEEAGVAVSKEQPHEAVA